LANAGVFPDTPEEARALVRELVAAGVDYIKIIVAHSFIFTYPEKFEPLADDVLEAIVDEAHKHGTWVMAHIDSAPDAIKMVGYGADEIDHLIAMGLVEIPDESAYDELFQLIILGIDDRVGTVKEGMLADLLIVDGDPSAKIDDIDAVSMVLREGSIVVDNMLS